MKVILMGNHMIGKSLYDHMDLTKSLVLNQPSKRCPTFPNGFRDLCKFGVEAIPPKKTQREKDMERCEKRIASKLLKRKK